MQDKAAQEKRELETPSLPDPIKEEEEEEQMEVDTPPVEEQKPVPTTTTPVKDEPPAPMDTKEESPMKTEPMSEDTATIKSEPTTESASDNTESAEVDNNAEDKTVVKIEDDEAVKTEEAEEAEEANKTVNLDTEDSSLLQAPVLVPQPKVVSRISACKSISLSLCLPFSSLLSNLSLFCYTKKSTNIKNKSLGFGTNSKYVQLFPYLSQL